MKSQYMSGAAFEAPGGPARASRSPARILLVTFGSLGDLFPYLALAGGLRRRGHEAVIATTRWHRERVESMGFPFYAIRPEMEMEEDSAEGAELMRKIMDGRRGPTFIIRKIMMPGLREQFADVDAVMGSLRPDVVVSHPIAYAAPLAAERRRLPWVGTALQPMVILSRYDLPIPPGASWAGGLRRLGPGVGRVVTGAVRAISSGWFAELETLRRELELPPRGHPQFDAQFSPDLNLGLFSGALCPPQPDWPGNLVLTGFPWEEAGEETALPEEVERFLSGGEPPVVFTLGSSAVRVGGDFYLESAAACRTLGRRALMLTGRPGWNRLPRPDPDILVADYLPHSLVFDRAAAIVHQGGIGTTAQALRAGKPMLVVPFSHDQEDNGRRVERLGAGRVLPREAYRASRVARDLRWLLESPAIARRAGEVGIRVRSERGVERACEALLSLAAKARANGGGGTACSSRSEST